MRILSVTAQRPDSTGSGSYLRETVRAFSRLGHAQAVVAGINKGDAADFDGDAAFYAVLFKTAALPFPVAGMSDEMPYESMRYSEMDETMLHAFLEAFRGVLLTAAEQFQPEVILCHHLYLLTAFTRRLFPDIPVWGVCHGSDIRQLSANPLRREYIKSGVCALDRICCLHETQRDAVLACYGAAPARVRTVGSGYNGDVFFDRGERRAHSGARLVFAGKISEKKGVLSLIASLDELGWDRGDFSLRLCGGWACEAQRERVARMIAASGWNASLLGNLDQRSLAREFNQGDVFILPSFYEGLPLVLVEALACGMRAVCTDLPGIKRWMDANVPNHGTVFVQPPRMLDIDTPDPQALPAFHAALAEAIREAYAAPKSGADLSALSWRSVCARILAK